RGCSAARRRGPTAETAGGRFDTTDSGPAGRPTGLQSSGSTGAIEHRTVLPPRAAATVCAAHRFGQKAPNEVPLLVREITGMSRSSEGHSIRMASVPIGVLTFLRRN